MKSFAIPLHRGSVSFEVGKVKIPGQFNLGIGAEQRVHATLRSACHDAHQALRRFFREARRKVGNDQYVEGLGNFARIGIVLVDRLELVSQVSLNHVFHVLGQISQPLRDMRTLRPNSMRD